MAVNVYLSGDSLVTALVADLKAAILTSTAWSNPAGQRVVATTTRGAEMVCDLADAAAGAQNLQFGVYRTAALADKIVRYIHWRTSGGATSDTVHWRVSASQESLYIDVEGPRAGEVNPVDVTYGSYRNSFFLGDLVPYHTADAVPAVVCAANIATSGAGTPQAYVSRNQADNASWVTAVLTTLRYPGISSNTSTSYINGVQRLSSDGKTYLLPYVVFEGVAGLRGRLGKCFFAGGNVEGAASTVADVLPALYSKYTYEGDTYILVNPVRCGSTSFYLSPFGAVDASQVYHSPIIAVPFA